MHFIPSSYVEIVLQTSPMFARPLLSSFRGHSCRSADDIFLQNTYKNLKRLCHHESESAADPAKHLKDHDRDDSYEDSGLWSHTGWPAEFVKK
jgi:hypothetical protein